MVEWVRATRAHPCPVCSRTHYCSVSADGGLVCCTRTASDRPTSDGAGWLHHRGPGTNGHADAFVNGRKTPGKRTRYEIRDADGALVALHVRRDLRDGTKRIHWELPDGTMGLNGRSPSALPLYGIHAVIAEPIGSVVFVCEGEKATDALAALGVHAVGTVTGADTIPTDDVLGVLTGFVVVLWPDADDKGRRHMDRIADRLASLHVDTRVLAWPDAGPGGDAADFVAAGLGKDELRELYYAAVVVDAATPSAESEAAPAEAPPEASGVTAVALTDVGNAERLVALHGADIRWCDEMGRWLHWSGVRWVQTGATILQDLAKWTVRALEVEAAASTDPEQRVALLKWAKASGSGRAVAAMVTLCKTVTGAIAVDADRLDADPWLLGVENGVVDLRTGRVRAADRADLITKSCRSPFDEQATCPLWEDFLETIFAGDGEVIRYVQRAVGYSLTGTTGERVVFIGHGAGTNGKTTFLEVVAYILGTYAMSTPVETLIARKDRGIPNDLARLRSARFVSAVESERGAKLAEAFIKAVTGGDRVTARFLHQEFFDFIPQLKLWLATNHRPEIASGGKAIWRRVRLLPFGVEIAEPDIDPDIKAKLLAQAPGILAWMVRGCLAWQRTGLQEPASIRAANQGYEEDEDVLGAFLEDRAIVDPNVWVSIADLYAAFKDWAEAHGEEKLSSKAFSQAMAERRGIRRGRQGGTGVRGFSGVRLMPGETKKKRQPDGLDD